MHKKALKPLHQPIKESYPGKPPLNTEARCMDGYQTKNQISDNFASHF